MAQVESVSVAIDELPLGITFRYPIEGDHGVLLVAAQTRITKHVLSRLSERGIQSIAVHPSDVASFAKAKKPKSLGKRERSVSDGDWVPRQPIKDLLVDRHDEGLSQQRTERLKRGMGQAKAEFDRMQTMLGNSQLQSIEELAGISEVYAKAMVDDHDQTVGVIGTATAVADLAERSVRLSVIGMAIAIELGLDGLQTVEIGMAGLLHDIGLYAMDPKYTQASQRFTEAERWEFQKHPLVSVECIQEIVDVPNAVRLAVAQVHEQFDGSGYPRGVQNNRIHLYARILNVVDTYLQLIAPTADRLPIIPHDALGLILFQASNGIFDPQVVRAFLNTKSMFPLGSMVELENGELAQVIRRPKQGFAAPVVCDSHGNRIELESGSRTIARPVPDPHINQMRLTKQMMQQATWCPTLSSFRF